MYGSGANGLTAVAPAKIQPSAFSRVKRQQLDYVTSQLDTRVVDPATGGSKVEAQAAISAQIEAKFAAFLGEQGAEFVGELPTLYASVRWLISRVDAIQYKARKN